MLNFLFIIILFLLLNSIRINFFVLLVLFIVCPFNFIKNQIYFNFNKLNNIYCFLNIKFLNYRNFVNNDKNKII